MTGNERQTDIVIQGVKGAPTLMKRVWINGTEVTVTQILIRGNTQGSTPDVATVRLDLVPSALAFIEPPEEPGDDECPDCAPPNGVRR